MIFLDAHVVVWLYEKNEAQFTSHARNMIDQHDLKISPIVLLEIQYLYEIRRVTQRADDMFEDLHTRIGLSIDRTDWHAITLQAFNINWTRDPFDRYIVAHASVDGHALLTADQKILAHYPHAVWDAKSVVNLRCK